MRKICESIFFNQTCRPANYIPLYLVPKSRDSWSTFGVWHKHIHSYSSQWIIILWTELPKYCLKNRLKMFNFWVFFCSQMFIRWPLVAASFTYTKTIICRVAFDEIDTYISNCPFSKVHLYLNEIFWYQSRITSTIWLYWNHQNICVKHWISRDFEELSSLKLGDEIDEILDIPNTYLMK